MTTNAKKGPLWESVERLDVLEDESPRGICAARGCRRGHRLRPWAGAFGVRYLCTRHRALYREHDRILAKIRSLR